MTTLPLAGKVAVVLGGSRGIGAAVVRRLAADGASVLFTFASAKAQAAAVAAEVEAAGGRAVALRADSADPQAIRDAVAQAARQFGGLDILVNNAGVGAIAPIGDLTLADVDRALAVNVRGAYAAAQAAVLRLSEGGRMIHVGSCVTERVPGPGMTLYAMSKSAITGLSKSLARELGSRGITSNVVHPGPIDTDMNPADGPFAEAQLTNLAVPRFGTSAEIAAAITYLAGPQAAYITGTALSIDGGHAA
jgi:3-oxoacyl-[acyl-carrier protein] reductase